MTTTFRFLRWLRRKRIWKAGSTRLVPRNGGHRRRRGDRCLRSRICRHSRPCYMSRRCSHLRPPPTTRRQFGRGGGRNSAWHEPNSGRTPQRRRTWISSRPMVWAGGWMCGFLDGGLGVSPPPGPPPPTPFCFVIGGGPSPRFLTVTC